MANRYDDPRYLLAELAIKLQQDRPVRHLTNTELARLIREILNEANAYDLGNEE